MTWKITVDNVAGILDGHATIEPGLNAVRASNWQGKSSFVAAIETALGVATPLTEGEERGSVNLHLPDREVTVDLVRKNGEVIRRGEPYLTDEYDAVRVGLFACLGETNEVRRAVRRGENLEDILLRPLDFQNIDQRIADLKRERERVESELAQAREARRRLPSVTEKVTRLESELEELRDRYEELTGGGGDATAAQSARGELAQARSERERAENRIERLETTIERTASQLEEKRTELSEIEVEDEGALESRLAKEREELDSLKRDAEVLQSVYSATEMVLQENRLGLLTDVKRGLAGDSVTCWTCGSEADRADIEERLDALGDRISDLRGQIESRRETVEELEARSEEIAQSRRRKRDLEAEVGELEEKLADKRQQLDEAREQRERTREQIDELAEVVDETVQEITDVESDIKYRKAELKEVRDERDSLERRAGRVERLSGERASIRDEIEELRNRKDQLKHETREAFDEAMEDVLERFEAGFEGARLTSNFDLVVARDGQEASREALSEGELELLGFVTALAGHEAFDVAETVPIMLVDGVGALDENNLRALVEYLQGRVEYLVFTAYPEYTAFDGHEIDPGNWTIATDPEASAQ
jgi:DNA repair exonuclease SbcCD ATPase subunit